VSIRRLRRALGTTLLPTAMPLPVMTDFMRRLE
jgi:hypothetical protein